MRYEHAHSRALCPSLRRGSGGICCSVLEGEPQVAGVERCTMYTVQSTESNRPRILVTLGVSTVGLNQSWTEAVEMIFLHLVQKFHILSSSLSQITAHINRNLSKKGSLRASLLQPAFRRVFVWKWCPSTIRHVTRCRSRPLDRSVTPTGVTGRDLSCRCLS